MGTVIPVSDRSSLAQLELVRRFPLPVLPSRHRPAVHTVELAGGVAAVPAGLVGLISESLAWPHRSLFRLLRRILPIRKVGTESQKICKRCDSVPIKIAIDPRSS